jgi:hypothetical protein
MYHKQKFPLWPVWGNGLGQSFFLEVTLSSGQVEWSACRTVILLKFTIVSSFEEWYVLEVDVQDSHFLRKWFEQSFAREDSFSLGCTMFSVRGMA